MSELVPWSRANSLERATQRETNAIHAQTRTQVTKGQAMTAAGKQAMFNVLDLKQTQKELELVNPSAAELLNLVANSVGMEIVASTRRFCFELDN